MAKYLIAEGKVTAERLFPINTIKKLKADDYTFCLVRTSKGYFAFEHTCPHQRHSLALGHINGYNQVVCPLHHYAFDLVLGDEESFNCDALKTYPVTLEEENLFVDLA